MSEQTPDPPVLPEWPTAADPPEPDEEQVRLESERERQERALQHRAEQYVELGKNPIFQRFLAELQAKGEQQEALFTATVKTGIQQGQDLAEWSRKLYSLQGMIEGLAYPAKVIELAQQALERLDREAEAEEAAVERESEPDDGRSF